MHNKGHKKMRNLFIWAEVGKQTGLVIDIDCGLFSRFVALKMSICAGHAWSFNDYKEKAINRISMDDP